MENDLRHPLHIEFYGLPGCGKSTISHRLADEFRNNEYIVEEPSYNLDHTFNKTTRQLIKLIKTICFRLHSPSLYSRIKVLVADNGYKGMGAFLQIANIAQKINTYQKIQKGQVIIWDQGITQAAISLSATGIIPANDNEKKILSLLAPCPYLIRVYIVCDIHTALKRMEGRKTNDSRVEKIKSEADKYSALQLILKNCDTIDSKSSIVADSNKMGLDEMQNVLFKKILDSFKNI